MADTGEAHEADLALITQAVESRGDASGAQDIVHADGAPSVAALSGDAVVQLEEVDLLGLEALQALRDRSIDGAVDVGQVGSAGVKAANTASAMRWLTSAAQPETGRGYLA